MKKPAIFKMLDVKRKALLRLPGRALHIWLYYWMREGQERVAWASEEELCEALDANRDTMRKWRKWLVENGWLKPIGHQNAKSRAFAIPKFRVDEGTMPERSSDGRSRNLPLRKSSEPTKLSGITSAESFSVVAAETFGEEVEPFELEPKEQVQPMLVSSLVDSDDSLRSSSTDSADASLTEGRKEQNLQDDSANRNQKEPREYPWYHAMHEEFGSISELGNAICWDKLERALNYYGWGTNEVRGCLRWAFAHKFWKTRIVSFDSFVSACWKCVISEEDGGVGERGIMAQYQRVLGKVRGEQQREPSLTDTGFDLEEAE